jgi:hypothetical protein
MLEIHKLRPRKKMKKIFKVLLIASVCVFVLASVLGVLVWVQRDQIKQYAINQLNEQLTAPIAVQTIDISFFDQFPKVSVALNRVSLQDPLRKKYELFSAQKVFVAFNIMDVLAKNYQIRLIAADSGSCSIYTDKKGRANYMIVKPSDKPGDDVFLKLTEVKLHSMSIHYVDESSQFEVVTDVREAKLSGDFKGKKESIGLEGDFYMHRMISSKNTLVKNKDIRMETVLQIDGEKNQYTFSKSNLKIGVLGLECSGKIQNQKTYTDLDMEFSAPGMRITDLLELLPGSYAKQVSEYQSTGSIYFNGSIKGKLSNKQNPAVQVQFGVKDGTLKAEKGTISIDQLECKGEFSNGKTGKLADAYLILPVFKFRLGKGHFNGALDLRNFNDPYIDLAIEGSAPVSDVIAFTKGDWIESGSGQVEVDLALKGKVKQLSGKAGLFESTTSGRVTLDASNLVIKGHKKNIQSLTGTMRLEQKDLVIETFSARVDQSDISVSGRFKNIVPYLFNNGKQLEANITYKSTYLDVENMVFPSSASASSQSSEAMSLPDQILVNATVDIGKLRFHEFNAQNVKGTVYWKGKQILAENVKAETLNGTISLNGQLENTKDGSFVVGSGIQFTQVDIDQLFKQCNNFGQQDLTDKHIKGKMSGTIELAGVWNSKLECDLNKLSALCSITVKQGELVNYKPLEALSKYVKLEDLQSLKFADLHNEIEIRKGVITIPEMMVNNNALNLTVSGMHTFENYLDYHFKIKLGDILAKKFKQRHSEFEEEQEEDKRNIYISMKGPFDKLAFTYDKKEARKQVKQDMQKEREEVKKIWRKELGLEKDETIKEKQKDSEELEFEAE